MVQRIDKDLGRFRKIVHQKIKSNLGKYISNGEMIGKKGNDLVSIPLPQIDLPRFKYGPKGNGGVGAGDGDVGQPLGPGKGQGGNGAGSGGGGEHILEVELTFDELAEILGEELKLPRLEPKAHGEIIEEKNKYTGIRTVGPESLRHFKRSFKRALLRQIAEHTYDPENPKVIPIKEDKRYKAGKPTPHPQTTAVIINMMDVSGSMTDEQKKIVRLKSFWTDIWIGRHYKNIVKVYIIHDDKAKEVDEHTFYHTRESGGTKISSAIKLANEIIDEKFPPSLWNIYVLYEGDGDNWGDDNSIAIKSIEELLPKINLFGYDEVGIGSPVSGFIGMGIKSKTFYNYIEDNFKKQIEEGMLRLTKTPDKDKITESIRALFEAKQKFAATA